MTLGRPILDEYVWLDHRPVALIRGSFTSGWVREPDGNSSCSTDGSPVACGIYFLVTDHLGKPVLMLDSSRRVTGAGDYDPFGYVNRVTFHGGTAHPYVHNTNVTVADFTQAAGGPDVTVDMRVQFHLVDAEMDQGGTACVDFAEVSDPDAQKLLAGQICGYRGQYWTDWLQPSAGHLKVDFQSDGKNCCPGPLGCQVGPVCQEFPDFPYTGVVVESYEYRRYQTGAQPFWTPLRFPGQYYDAETDLFENWNRYYDPSIGRYLQPEPLAALDPQTSADPAYAYAGNNPLASTDPSGFYVLQNPPCENWALAVAKAKEKAGCGANGVQATCSKCKLPCNICMFLEDGNLPEAFIRITINGTTANGAVAITPSIPGKVVLFPIRLCTGARNVDTLARAMFHEALHLCKEVGGSGSRTGDSILRPFFGGSDPDAEDTTDECFE